MRDTCLRGINSPEISKLHEIVESFARKRVGAYHMTSRIEWARYFEHAIKVCSVCPENANLIDIGCGNGYFAVMLKLLRPDLTVVAVDICPKDEWHTFEKYGITFVVADAFDTKLKRSSFDVAFSSGLFEHVDNTRFLAEVCRILKPGGLNIVFNIPNRFSVTENTARMLGFFKLVPGETEQRYIKRQITEIFTKGGFRSVSIIREGLVPAQFGVVSGGIERLLNCIPRFLLKIDRILNFYPLNTFAQSFLAVSRKRY